MIFEAWLVMKLWRQTQAFPARLRAAERAAAATAYGKHPN
jgi:hypothetical protein